MQGGTGGGVAVALVIVQVGHGKVLTGSGGTLHQSVDVTAGHRDGQQANGGQHRETAAHVIRHHKGLVTLAIGQTLQGTASLIGGDVGAAHRLVVAVALLQQLTEYAEGDGGLGGGARLGDYVDGYAATLADLQQFRQLRAGDAVTRKVDVGGILFLGVVVVGLEEFDGGAGTQIGAADADDDKHVGILFDTGGSRLDARKLLLVIVDGQVHPAEEITAQTGAAVQQVVGYRHLRLQSQNLCLGEKAVCVFGFQFDCHSHPPFKKLGIFPHPHFVHIFYTIVSNFATVNCEIFCLFLQNQRSKASKSRLYAQRKVTAGTD